MPASTITSSPAQSNENLKLEDTISDYLYRRAQVAANSCPRWRIKRFFRDMYLQIYVPVRRFFRDDVDVTGITVSEGEDMYAGDRVSTEGIGYLGLKRSEWTVREKCGGNMEESPGKRFTGVNKGEETSLQGCGAAISVHMMKARERSELIHQYHKPLDISLIGFKGDQIWPGDEEN